jgi:hypothetical protein
MASPGVSSRRNIRNIEPAAFTGPGRAPEYRMPAEEKHPARHRVPERAEFGRLVIDVIDGPGHGIASACGSVSSTRNLNRFARS